MELIAAGPQGPVALAYGAYLIDGGARLRCGLLLIKKDQPDEILTFTEPETKRELRVRLPEEAMAPKGNARFSFETLEVV